MCMNKYLYYTHNRVKHFHIPTETFLFNIFLHNKSVSWTVCKCDEHRIIRIYKNFLTFTNTVMFNIL